MADFYRQNKGKINQVIVNEVHSNVSQEVIEITSDRLTLILNKYIDCLNKANEWQTPLTIIITIILVLCTTEFKDALGLSAEVWEAIFILSMVLSLLWLARALIKLSKAMTVEDVIKVVKNQS